MPSMGTRLAILALISPIIVVALVVTIMLIVLTHNQTAIGILAAAAFLGFTARTVWRVFHCRLVIRLGNFYSCGVFRTVTVPLTALTSIDPVRLLPGSPNSPWILLLSTSSGRTTRVMASIGRSRKERIAVLAVLASEGLSVKYGNSYLDRGWS